MNGYQHLGLVERRQIYQLAATGRSVHQIAASRQRHRSTIYRELKRNQHLDDEPVFRGYFPTAAQTMAARRRVRGSKIVRSPSLPPISPTACQQLGRRSRLRDIFDAIAVIMKPSVTRPMPLPTGLGLAANGPTCASAGRLDGEPPTTTVTATKLPCQNWGLYLPVLTEISLEEKPCLA